MGDREDQLLKELYNQGRPPEVLDPPKFDEVFHRAQAAAGPSPRRRPALWIGAAAAVMAVVVAMTVLTGEGASPPGGLAPSGEPTEVAQGVWDQQGAAAAAEPLAVDDPTDWEALLDFADEVWEWESPTDFLL